ncbi:hypothetical protein HDU86_007352 [Geranomyces michiganensis]|nr:hypothetical protein HDU86_007352 [Geranomyces michiganensis]
MASPQLLAADFTKLRDAYETGDYVRTSEIATSILKASPYDADALHAKIVADIRLEQYARALSTLDDTKVPDSVRDEFILEHAYCLYRTGEFSASLKLIRTRREDAVELLGEAAARSMRHLEAQVVRDGVETICGMAFWTSGLIRGICVMLYLLHQLFRLDEYAQCLAVYDQLEADADEAEESELRVNIAAVKAAAVAAGVDVTAQINVQKATDPWDLLHNVACTRISQGDYDAAEELLAIALRQCEELQAANEADKDDVDMIKLQLGFLRQKQHWHREAQELYNEVLQSGTETVISRIIAVNNVSSLNGDFETATNAYRGLRNSHPEYKLTNEQAKIFDLNAAIVMLNPAEPRYKEARKRAAALTAQYPSDPTPWLILAAIESMSKSSASVETLLQSPAEKVSDPLPLHLAIAQAFMVKGAFPKAQSYLSKSLKPGPKEMFLPGVVSLLAWLHSQMGELQRAAQVLDEAGKFWESQESANYRASLKHLASYRLRLSQPEEAARLYEKMVRADPTDWESVAGLILASSVGDKRDEAERYRDYLPAEVLADPTGYDADELERSLLAGSRPPKEPKPKSRKRKIRLPKDMSVPLDPERWLAKRDRSTYKPARNKGKKSLGTGPQGAAVEGGGIVEARVLTKVGLTVQAPLAAPTLQRRTAPGGEFKCTVRQNLAADRAANMNNFGDFSSLALREKAASAASLAVQAPVADASPAPAAVAAKSTANKKKKKGKK